MTPIHRSKRASMVPAGRPRKEVDTTAYSGRFSVHLRTLREKAGLTVEEVAASMDVTIGTIYFWEKAMSFPKVDQLPPLARVLKLKDVRSLFPKG